jgi:HlyD family secretion protein
MKKKFIAYFIIALALILGGLLQAVEGKDAVSRAERKKQAVLEADQKIIHYDNRPGVISEVNKSVGDSVQQGDTLYTVKLTEGGETAIYAQEEGIVSQLLVKAGDRVNPGAPVAAIHGKSYYADFYIQENQIHKLKSNSKISVTFPNLEQPLEAEGVITSISAAPQFATLRMSRERGQADLSMYIVRVSLDANSDLLPGMTAEVDLDAIAH